MGFKISDIVNIINSITTWCNQTLQPKGNYLTQETARADGTSLSGIRFGIDGQGNYGYYKTGADTVTPFLTGSTFSGIVEELTNKTVVNIQSNAMISGCNIPYNTKMVVIFCALHSTTSTVSFPKFYNGNTEFISMDRRNDVKYMTYGTIDIGGNMYKDFMWILQKDFLQNENIYGTQWELNFSDSTALDEFDVSVYSIK